MDRNNTHTHSIPATLLYRRASVMLIGLLFLYALLTCRLTHLQYVEHIRLQQESRQQRQSAIRWSPWRGQIEDQTGQPLAISVRVRSCAIDPKIVTEQGTGLDATLAFLSDTLSLTPANIQQIRQRATRTSVRHGEERPSRFVWIRRMLAEKEYETLAQAINTFNERAAEQENGPAAQPLRGILFPPEYQRRYPQHTLGAHYLGFVNIDGKGQEGVEQMTNAFLTGLTSVHRIERDARRRAMANDTGRDDTNRHGLTVVLSMDATIQLIAEEEMKRAVEKYTPSAATVVIMNPYTGDVLAMANYPAFDPNHPAATPAGHRMNQAIHSIMEPGSTFKPFVLAAALEQKRVTLRTMIHCENGAWHMPCGRVLHDAHPYGRLSAELIVVKSSNTGIAKIARLLGKSELYETARNFGFGERSGVPMRGELRGTLHPLRQWTAYSMGSIPMGQEIAVTPLQLATAYSVFANGGNLLRPRIVKELRDRNGTPVKQFPVIVRDRQVLSPETAAVMRNVLRKVVTHGTGRRLKTAEYPLAGKTGTAQLVANAAERRQGHTGYSPDRYVANFVGIAPFDVPRIVVAVSVREPHGSHYGGTVAGPVVRDICRRTLPYLGEPSRNRREVVSR